GLMVLQFGTGSLADERDTVVTEIMGLDPVEPAVEDTTEAEDTPPQPPSQPYVLSGMARNSDQIIGHGAIFDMPAGRTGRGRAVVFTFNPMHRYLNHHDAGMVLNAILNWNDLGGGEGMSGETEGS
ncbi:MAG: hypothetical protein V3T56_09255, partial [Gemmatimonadales bacterium]